MRVAADRLGLGEPVQAACPDRALSTRSGRRVAQTQTPRVTLNARHERWCKGAQRPLRRTLDGMARSSETILTTSACYRGQRVGVAGQKPAAGGLFAVYGDPMTGQLLCFSADARCYR